MQYHYRAYQDRDHIVATQMTLGNLKATLLERTPPQLAFDENVVTASAAAEMEPRATGTGLPSQVSVCRGTYLVCVRHCVSV